MKVWKLGIGLGVLALVISAFFLFHKGTQLSLCSQNAHFKIYCAQEDQNVSEQLLDQLEEMFEKLSKDFNHTYSSVITVEIYPDIHSFHKAIGKPSAPDWISSRADNNSIKGVSPSNPGSYHSYDSMIRSYKVGLAHLFLMDNKESYKDAPYWLRQGASLYKGGMNYKDIKGEIPTIAQLDSIVDCVIDFSKINGFHVSYFMVKFIDQQWGWESVLKLLENYSQFEEIIGLSKEEFRDKFIKSLQ